MNRNIILESWVEECAETIAKETFNLVKSLSAKKNIFGLATSKFLHHYIKLSVYESLTNLPKEPKNDEEAYTLTSNNFSEFKGYVQHEIALAFESAFTKYSGRKTEYYCVIRPIPEPINKLPV